MDFHIFGPDENALPPQKRVGFICNCTIVRIIVLPIQKSTQTWSFFFPPSYLLPTRTYQNKGGFRLKKCQQQQLHSHIIQITMKRTREGSDRCGTHGHHVHSWSWGVAMAHRTMAITGLEMGGKEGKDGAQSTDTCLRGLPGDARMATPAWRRLVVSHADHGETSTSRCNIRWTAIFIL